MIRYIFLTGVMALMLTACSQNQPKPQPQKFGTQVYDSTALHVALVPNKDCLPVYFAERRGIFEKLGLKIQIASYESQLECDTALLSGMADGGWADMTRLKSYGNRADSLSPVWKSSDTWQIFVCKKLRIKDVKTLKGRTIGIARLSAANVVLDAALQKAGIAGNEVYRPQINNQKLRAEMLNGDQIDAAVLSWPYTSLALSQNHRSIFTHRSDTPLTCFVQNKKSGTNKGTKAQWELFEKGRKMAMDSIRIKGNASFSLILQKDYGLPKEVADTIKF